MFETQKDPISNVPSGMRCPQCHSRTTGLANYCSVCGYDLARQTGKKSTFRFLKILATIMLGSILLFALLLYNKYNALLTLRNSARFKTAISAVQEKPLPPKNETTESMQFGETDRPRLPAIPAGKLTLFDITGRKIDSYPGVAVSGGWIALPVKFAYGAYEWAFTSNTGTRLPVQGCIWHEGDPIGLWRIDDTLDVQGPPLTAWNPDLELLWIALDTDSEPIAVQPEHFSEAVLFVNISSPEISSLPPGCFLQEGRVVGWTFGEMMPGGFLWTGNAGSDLSADFRIDDFYRLTFAESREESFIKALSNESLSDDELFALLTAAFDNDTKMPAKDIPLRLSVAEITKQLVALVDRLADANRYEEINADLDLSTLLQIQNLHLAATAVEAKARSENSEAATELTRQLRQLGPAIWFDDQSPLLAIQRRLWVKRIEETANIESAAAALNILPEARQLFPRDPALHLLTVKLYLDDRQWLKAKSLLSERSYPDEFKDTVAVLKNRIEEMEALEGQTVIRFPPGAQRIPVEVRLNDLLTQVFTIDTGATTSTIPPSAARAIGIDLGRLPLDRSFYSASDVSKAAGITLDSVAINQLKVYDLPVLIIELPNQTDMGLLGMDFLGNFKMNLDSDAGTLTLAPR